jgi:hypothetical protein
MSAVCGIGISKNGNAILLEADARHIRVMDHMGHLVDVRLVERIPIPEKFMDMWPWR